VRRIVPAFARRVNDILVHACLYAAARRGGFLVAVVRKKSPHADWREKLMTESALFVTLWALC
jgi:hypothetical protein